MKKEEIPDLVPRLAYTRYGEYSSGWKRVEILALGGTWPPYKGWKSQAILRLSSGIQEEISRLRLLENQKNRDEKLERRADRKKKRRAKKINLNRRHQADVLKEPFVPYRKSGKDGFYLSWEWKKARFITIKRYGATCMCCGATERIVVDHILSRRKHPHLELDLDNLQVLCNDCNMGKSWDDTTDFRPSEGGLSPEEFEQIRLVYDASMKI